MSKRPSKAAPASAYDQELIMELGRCFMRAAVHRFIEEQKAQLEPPKVEKPVGKKKRAGKGGQK
jgi:hypothetical protein